MQVSIRPKVCGWYAVVAISGSMSQKMKRNDMSRGISVKKNVVAKKDMKEDKTPSNPMIAGSSMTSSVV